MRTDGAQQPEPGRIGSLDGLRAIAILLVLLSHLTPTRESSAGISSIVFKIADIGWSGVDLFFVLSGFLITGILWKNREKGRPLSSFWMRRVLRIVPVYFLTLLFLFFLAPLLLGLGQLQPLPVQLPYWLYLNNYVDALQIDWFATGHLWSLALEMQFYVLWPLVILSAKPKTVIRLGCALLIFSLAGRALLVADNAGWDVTYRWLPWRMDGLIVGSVLATSIRYQTSLAQVRSIPLAVVVAVLAAIVFYAAWFGYGSSIFKPPLNWQFATLRTILPTVLSLLFGGVLLLSLREGPLASILDWNVFKPIALYSYGLYIIHGLLMPTFEYHMHPDAIRGWAGSKDSAIYIYFCVTSLVSFVLAAASFELFEKRFLALKARF